MANLQGEQRGLALAVLDTLSACANPYRRTQRIPDSETPSPGELPGRGGKGRLYNAIVNCPDPQAAIQRLKAQAERARCAQDRREAAVFQLDAMGVLDADD